MAGRLIAWLPVALFLGLGAIFAVTLLGRERAAGEIVSPLVGKPLPAFTLEGLDGRPPVSDADFRTGEVTVLNLFASWCAPCRLEHPLLKGLAASGVRVVGIAYKDRPENTRGFLVSLGDPFALVGLDQEGRVGIDLGITGVPETFIIDGNGIVRHKHTGPIDAGIVRDELMPLIAQLRAESAATGLTGR